MTFVRWGIGAFLEADGDVTAIVLSNLDSSAAGSLGTAAYKALRAD